MYSERKALCSLSQNKRAFTCIPRARTHPHSGIALTQSLAKPREQKTRGWLCVCVVQFCKGNPPDGRILETGIVDVPTPATIQPTNKCICSFSQLLPVRYRGKRTPCHSSSCSSIVARNSRFHLIMGIVRIYVMTLVPDPSAPRTTAGRFIAGDEEG